MEESSSRQRRAGSSCGLGSERAACAWTLSKRRIHSGFAAMAAYAAIKEISVAAVLRLVDDHRRAAVALNVRAPARVSAIAQGQLLPKLAAYRPRK